MSDDAKTLVCVSDGGSNKLFVGWTIWDEDEFKKKVEAGAVIALEDVRILREVTMPAAQGISITVQVIPYAACLAGCDLKIKVTHYFYPNEADTKKLKELIAACEKAELVDRAHRQGIATPDGMKTRPGGRLVD